MIGCSSGKEDTPPAYTISGTVTGAEIADVTITFEDAANVKTMNAAYTAFTLNDSSAISVKTDQYGKFKCPGLKNGMYIVTPSKEGYVFEPVSLNAYISGANVSNIHFQSTASTTPTYSISGTVSGGVKQNVTITLSGKASGTTTTNIDGNYSFNGLQNGDYTVTPSHPQYTFTPTNRSITLNGANSTGNDMTATSIPVATYSISGKITGATLANVTVRLTGAATKSETTDINGNYIFTNCLNGSYTVAPIKDGFTFSPSSRAVVVQGVNTSVSDFTASANPAPTFTILGAVGGNVKEGVTISLEKMSQVNLTTNATTTTNTSGNYSFADIENGSYKLTPSYLDYIFSPTNQTVTVNGANVTAETFIASRPLADICNVTDVFPTPPALHVDGYQIKDINNSVVILKGINFNHYMEYPYYPDQQGAAGFIPRLDWSHSAYDYNKVKKWGLNVVRLNISYTHIINDDAFNNLKMQVKWAKDNGLYIIIAYFVPDGCNDDNADYYSDEKFWANIINTADKTVNENSQYFKNYAANWRKISDQFKAEPHVIYELLNEPQSKGGLDNTSYTDFVKKMVKQIRSNNDHHIIIVDGLKYANVEPQYLAFLKNLSGVDQNIVYSFHSYDPKDFVFQECYWKTKDCEAFSGSDSRKTLKTTDIDWPTITIDNISLSEERPILGLTCNKQPGSCLLKKIEFYDASDQLLFSEDFINKIEDPNFKFNNPNDIGKLIDTSRACRKWETQSNGFNQTAVGSIVGIDQYVGENILRIGQTINKENIDSYKDDSASWASATFLGWISCTDGSIPKIDKNKKYRMKITLKGESFASYGSVTVFFLNPVTPYNTLKQWEIKRYKDNVNLNTVFSSDADMIDGHYKAMDIISKKFKVPVFLGEFGMPIRVYQSGDDEKFLQMLMDKASLYGLHWTLFVYRDPLDAQSWCDGVTCGQKRTFGLYSGWEKKVCEMEQDSAMGTNPDNALYFYRPNIIKKIQENMLKP